MSATLTNNCRIRMTSKLKSATRKRTRDAIKAGKIIKQPCKVCGSEQSEAHHDNYGDYLNVIWLCKLHHTETHYPGSAERRQKRNEIEAGRVIVPLLDHLSQGDVFTDPNTLSKYEVLGDAYYCKQRRYAVRRCKNLLSGKTAIKPIRFPVLI